MHDPKNIAKAFMVEADVDIKIARIAYINSFYSRSIFFSQQASEKSVKACLIMKGIFTSDHNTSSLFKALYENNIQDFREIQTAVERLERHGAKARFPLYQRTDLPIWIPSYSLKEDDARDSLEKGELVFNMIKEYLDSKVFAKPQ